MRTHQSPSARQLPKPRRQSGWALDRRGRRSIALLGIAACLAALTTAGQGPASLDATGSPRGGALSEAGLELLEDRLRADPHDREARAALIRHYGRARWDGGPAGRRHAELVVWLVEKQPRDPWFGGHGPELEIDPGVDPERYLRAKNLWLAHLEEAPRDLRLLGNAAAFLDRTDRDLAASLIERAQEIEPASAFWPFELGRLHWLDAWMPTPNPDDPRLVLAVSLFERAYSIGARWDPMRSQYAIHAMRGTFAVDRHADARAYATAALADAAYAADGDVRHAANIVLGRIALAEGDVGSAKEHLLASARVPVSPVLGSFGPKMTLALELLEHGEQSAVLDYFDLCSGFWDPDTLGTWADLVRAGRTPDFGGNLWY